MKKFRPMKPPAGSITLDQVQYPVMVSPKIDGIRAVVRDGVLSSSTMKPIPNNYIRDTLSNTAHDGLDGELTIGSPTDEMCFRNTTSGVMRHIGKPNFTYWVFDYLEDETIPFIQRYVKLQRCNKSFDERVKVLPQTIVHNLAQLVELETSFIHHGYEGIMMRSLDGLYKYGRSTIKQGWVLRYKRFQDDEAEIIGFTEGIRNENEKTMNAMGLMERATISANKTPNGMLGSFQVRDLKTNQEFSIGIGVSDELAKEVWENKDNYLGKLIKYGHFPIGCYSVPRFPAFKGFRDIEDMTKE